MKATGIVRKIDELGRIVIPIELRRTLGIDEKDGLEVFVDADRIVLKKYSPGCVICNSIENIDVVLEDSKLICSKCVDKISSVGKPRN